MFCPECRSEYRPGFNRCPDCDVDLVPQLPQNAIGSDGDAVPVAVFVTADHYEASLIKSLLASSGVEVWLFGENISRIYPFLNEIRLMVRPGQEELARAVLAEYRGRAGQSPTDGRLTPVMPFQEEQASEHEIDDNAAGERRCPLCTAVIQATARVCPECGYAF